MRINGVSNSIGARSTEFTLADCPTMDDRSEMNLKSSGRLKQEGKTDFYQIFPYGQINNKNNRNMFGYKLVKDIRITRYEDEIIRLEGEVGRLERALMKTKESEESLRKENRNLRDALKQHTAGNAPDTAETAVPETAPKKRTYRRKKPAIRKEE